MMGHEDINAGQRGVDSIGSNFQNEVGPYNQFGQSFLQPATNAINNISGTAGTQSYEDFMKNYQTSPGAKYQIQQADEGQNNSAASKGQLLSGTNERALSTINQGIAGTSANQAYGSYLQGNQQNFGQLESALGNMFGAIGIGTQATGQIAGLDSSQMNSTASLAASQAKNDQSKGSGIGSLFSGIGSMALAF
jgi:hypothetical protein